MARLPLADLLRTSRPPATAKPSPADDGLGTPGDGALDRTPTDRRPPPTARPGPPERAVPAEPTAPADLAPPPERSMPTDRLAPADRLAPVERAEPVDRTAPSKPTEVSHPDRPAPVDDLRPPGTRPRPPADETRIEPPTTTPPPPDASPAPVQEVPAGQDGGPPYESSFDPDDWSYEPESGLWWSGADRSFHAEPGGPAIPPDQAPTSVPAGADLLADAVAVDGMGFDLGGTWRDDAVLEARPLDDGGLWFDPAAGTFHDGPDGPIVGFHESLLDDAVSYPNRSLALEAEAARLGDAIEEAADLVDQLEAEGAPPKDIARAQAALEEATAAFDAHDAIEHPYEGFSGPDLLFAGGRWYALDGQQVHPMSEGRFLDLTEVESDIGNFLGQEMTAGTGLHGLVDGSLPGFVIDGATGEVHAHDPSAWTWDATSQAWVDDAGVRHDRPDGAALADDEVSDVGDFDSRVPLERLVPVRSADGTWLLHDPDTGTFGTLADPVPPLDDPPAGPYEYLGTRGLGSLPPFDRLDPDGPVYVDPTDDTYRLGEPDGPVIGFQEGAGIGVTFHNRSLDVEAERAELEQRFEAAVDQYGRIADAGGSPAELAAAQARVDHLEAEIEAVADAAPYVDFSGPDLTYVDGTWYATAPDGSFEPLTDGRYLDVSESPSAIGDYLGHEVAIGTPLQGAVPFDETSLVVDGETGALHAYDPTEWSYDEGSQAWVDGDGERFTQPGRWHGPPLADGEVATVGPFDSLVDLDQMALVHTGDGSLAWYDVEDGTWSDELTPGVPRPGDPPVGPYTVRSDGPYDQPPLDALEPGTTLHFDPETLLYHEGGPDGPVLGFHHGAEGTTYVDPGARLELTVADRAARLDPDVGIDAAEPGDLQGADGPWFHVDGHWYGADGAPLDLGPNPRVGDLPAGLRRAVLAEAGLEGAAETGLADDLVLDGATGELHLWDPAAIVWDDDQDAWVDAGTGAVVEDPLGVDEPTDDAEPDVAPDAEDDEAATEATDTTPTDPDPATLDGPTDTTPTDPDPATLDGPTDTTPTDPDPATLDGPNDTTPTDPDPATLDDAATEGDAAVDLGLPEADEPPPTASVDLTASPTFEPADRHDLAFNRGHASGDPDPTSLADDVTTGFRPEVDDEVLVPTAADDPLDEPLADPLDDAPEPDPAVDVDLGPDVEEPLEPDDDLDLPD